jgi:hypothetical protein
MEPDSKKYNQDSIERRVLLTTLSELEEGIRYVRKMLDANPHGLSLRQKEKLRWSLRIVVERAQRAHRAIAVNKTEEKYVAELVQEISRKTAIALRRNNAAPSESPVSERER